MHKPDPVETILARLMPPGLSEQGQRDMAAMLEDLAGPVLEISAAKPSLNLWRRWTIIGGIAAGGVAAAMIFPLASPPLPIVAATEQEVAPGFVLVGESDRIESTTDEGWFEDSDGSAMRTLRLSVIEENTIQDEETGIIMQLSEPREEILLMPVSAF